MSKISKKTMVVAAGIMAVALAAGSQAFAADYNLLNDVKVSGSIGAAVNGNIAGSGGVSIHGLGIELGGGGKSIDGYKPGLSIAGSIDPHDFLQVPRLELGGGYKLGVFGYGGAQMYSQDSTKAANGSGLPTDGASNTTPGKNLTKGFGGGGVKFSCTDSKISYTLAGDSRGEVKAGLEYAF